MLPPEISNYLNTRYYRYLDYAQYHASRVGIPDESLDILNEVLLSLLEKPEEKIVSLYNEKKDGYTGLDFFVLRMIRLNVISPTSPYRHKYKPIPVNTNVNHSDLEIEDEEYNENDRPSQILEQTHLIRGVLDELCIPDYDKRVFMWRMSGEAWSDWDGPETVRELFGTFYKVRNNVKEEIRKYKIRKAAAALLKTVESEVQIIKSNIRFKNDQISSSCNNYTMNN